MMHLNKKRKSKSDPGYKEPSGELQCHMIVYIYVGSDQQGITMLLLLSLRNKEPTMLFFQLFIGCQ